MAAIETHDLGKVFRVPARFADLCRGRLWSDPLVALDRVSLSVDAGEALGLIGPNGAGKSTLLRILAGLLRPTSGTARVLGEDVARVDAAFRMRVGLIMGDDRSFSFRLTGRQNLIFFAALFGWQGAAARDRVAGLLDRVGLAEAADRRAGSYSSGMRARLSLARSLLGDPEVVLADEPTRGLDPQAAAGFREQLGGLLRSGASLLLATHDLGEARRLCNRVALVGEGRIRDIVAPHDTARLLGVDG